MWKITSESVFESITADQSISRRSNVSLLLRSKPHLLFFFSSIDSSSVRRTTSQRCLLMNMYALSPLLKANLTSIKITGSCMCAGNHHHRLIQFKITRWNVQVKNTPSSPYMESLFMHMLKVVRNPCQKITLLLLKSKSVRVIVPESCF